MGRSRRWRRGSGFYLRMLIMAAVMCIDMVLKE